MTKRIINLLFFIVLNVFAASLSGIIPLFSRSANAEAELSIISVSYNFYNGLVVATNDESRDFKVDENFIALFDGDEKIGLSVGKCTALADGKVCIPLDSPFPAADNLNLEVIFGKGFAVSENGARLAEEEIWVYESFDDEYSTIRFRKISPADESDESDESNPEESIFESESFSESESEESDSAEESVSENESENISESESSSESESIDESESDSESISESEEVSGSESVEESESDSESISESEEVSGSESVEESESENGESLPESIPESESISESDGGNDAESDEESETNGNDSESESNPDESITTSGNDSGDESETKDESKADGESEPDNESNPPTSENRERGCKSNIYSGLTTGYPLAALFASAFIFFNSKKK